MASRTSWEGYLRLNLISVPVKAFTATAPDRGRIGFHLLHDKCKSRIRYKKVCPIHGEVPNHEIVSGYEQAKDQYVIVGKDEMRRLRPEEDKAIDIDIFVDPANFDPVYFTERSYYLVPDGKVAAMPYAVLQRVMAEEQRYAIATMVFSGREQIVAVRPAGKLLAITLLSYADQVKPPSAYEDDVPKVEVPAKELELARGLVEAAAADEFDLEQYKDQYSGRLLKLIEGKATVRGVKHKGKAEEAPAVINFEEALRKSLRQIKRGSSRTAKRPPRRKTG